MDNLIKAYCSRCFMRFDSGKNSFRAIKHSQLEHCDLFPCNREGGNCVRKFATVNSVNRHTHCYSKEQVDQWPESSKLNTGAKAENLKFDNLKFEKLNISDVNEFLANDLMFPESLPEGPPYKYPNNLTVSEVFKIIQRKLGKEFEEKNLQAIKEEFIKKGYTSAEVIRTAKANYGNWEFLYQEFKGVRESVHGVAHILKKIISKRMKV